MNKLFYISRVTTLIAVFYAAYYLLLRDNCLHTSISFIIDKSHHLEAMRHIIVLGLLPIYIGTMIFGSAMLGLYLGSKFQYLLVHLRKNKIDIGKKQFFEKFIAFSVRK